MGKKKHWFQVIEDTNVEVSAYSNYLLRHTLLPELLGKEEEAILYWGGKAVARKMTDEEIVELSIFFEKANWGTLTLLKEKRTERIYELVAPLMDKERPFALECGFLAQWIERQTGFVTEAHYEVINKKPCTCKITVRWDPKDPMTK